jgi:hypothetical protein
MVADFAGRQRDLKGGRKKPRLAKPQPDTAANPFHHHLFV